MNWISIDQEKCNECGICVQRCMSCFTQNQSGIVAHADITNCNLCGHCVSLCPTGAIWHKEMDMNNFKKIEKKSVFKKDDFISFIRARRSHRNFKDKPVMRPEIETLIDTCRYAPCGSNDQNVNIIIIEDRNRIEKLTAMTIDYFKQIGQPFIEQIEKLKKEAKDIPESLQRVVFYADRMIEAERAGINPIFYNAPAVIIFHAPQEGSTPKDNCVIASTTMGLCARTMGLESTYIGLFEIAAQGCADINKELDLPDGHQIYSVLIMGYPVFKYYSTVDRKPMNVQWM